MSTTAPAMPETDTTEKPAARKSPTELFEYSAWVHVGDGAQECDKRFDRCSNADHFHAWIRLPGPYQVRDINEKAQAAQARRMRRLRDPESDAYVILESELDALRDAANGGALSVLVEEILEQDHAEDLMRATRNVRLLEDESWEAPEDQPDAKAPKLYENIQQDFEEYSRQRELPEHERSEDYSELERTIAAYGTAVNAELESIIAPKRERLQGLPLDQLIDMVRKDRRESNAAEVYLHTYHSWQMYSCTYKPKPDGVPNVQVFNDFEAMKRDTPKPVIEALRAEFDRLSRLLGSDQAGNS